ncbi:MAG: hypothetical protein Q9166_001584 [cf. Caloplaca sp. 2 TL-2023]
MPPRRGIRRLSWHQDKTPEGSESSYGQEILPTVDPAALAQLPSQQQEAFRDMQENNKLRVLARWKREGRAIPPDSEAPSNDSTAQLVRPSSAPQLPELQMDVSTTMFAGAVDESSRFGRTKPGSQSAQEMVVEVGTKEVALAGHRQLGFTPSLLSIRTRSSQPELYADETPEQRCLRKLRRDEMALQKIDDDRNREWARFRGLGGVPPGLAVAGHSPTAADRIHARTIARNHAVVQATGRQPNANVVVDTLGIAREVDGEERAYRAANGAPDLRGPMFVRPGTPIASPAKLPVPAASNGTRSLHNEKASPLNDSGLSQGNVQTDGEGEKEDLPNEVQQQMSNVHVGPMKRVGKKIEASKNWIKNVLKSKTERKKKARIPGRPASRAHLYDEAQTGTATRISMTTIKAPRPSQPPLYLQRPPPILQQLSQPLCPPPPPPPPSPPPTLQKPSEPLYLQRPPPTLQPPNQLVDNQSAAVSREGHGKRRTTRAMMENYD